MIQLRTEGLSLDQAPPISIPFRFFITASLFSVCVGLLLTIDGTDVLSSRWSPAALAVTHLVTVGFLAQVMTGAMIQLVPVLAGSPIARVETIGWVVYFALMLGALLLVSGFLFSHKLFLIAGGGLLGLGFFTIFAASGMALLKVRKRTHVTRGLWLGWVALIPTLLLGGYLVAGLYGIVHLPDFKQIVTLHLSWGLLGWVGVLLFSLLFELVPMFYITRGLPSFVRQWLMPAIVLLLVVFTISKFLHSGLLKASLLIVVFIFVILAIATLKAIGQRKRKRVDVTLLFLLTGLMSVLLSAIVWLSVGNDLLIGALLLGGVCLTVPIGIIYKVVPFLCWFHLQAQQVKKNRFDYTLPSMSRFIPEKEVRHQFVWHLAALLAFLLAFQYAGLIRVAGLFFTLSSVYLFKNLLAAYSAFNKEQKALCSI